MGKYNYNQGKPNRPRKQYDMGGRVTSCPDGYHMMPDGTCMIGESHGSSGGSYRRGGRVRKYHSGGLASHQHTHTFGPDESDFLDPQGTINWGGNIGGSHSNIGTPHQSMGSDHHLHTHPVQSRGNWGLQNPNATRTGTNRNIMANVGGHTVPRHTHRYGYSDGSYPGGLEFQSPTAHEMTSHYQGAIYTNWADEPIHLRRGTQPIGNRRNRRSRRRRRR